MLLMDNKVIKQWTIFKYFEYWTIRTTKSFMYEKLNNYELIHNITKSLINLIN